MAIVNLVQGTGSIQNTATKLAAVSNSPVSFNNFLTEAINRTTMQTLDNNTAKVQSSSPQSLLARTNNQNNADNLTAMVNNNSQNPVQESDWLALKPDDYTMEKFAEKIADANTRLSYLNPEQLPNNVTKPEEGISRSTDMVSPPTFEETSGGVNRIDYTRSGKVLTFIPSFEWRKTTSDSAVGMAYSQQTPWGFRTLFIRDGSRRTPDGYSEGGYAADIERYKSGNNQVGYVASEKADSGKGVQSYNGDATRRVAYLDTNDALIRLQYASDVFMKQQLEDKAEDIKRSLV